MTATLPSPDPALLLRARPWLHRFAQRVSAKHGSLLGPEEACSVADLAMVRAWHRFEPDRGQRFLTYARHWVHGAVVRATSREVQRREDHASAVVLFPARAEPVQRVRAELSRELGRLGPVERDILEAHVLAGERLAELARRAGRHRSWATRAYARAVGQLRARQGLTDTPGRSG